MNYKFLTHMVHSTPFRVYKIKNVAINNRLFCIRDRQLPYELWVTYDEPHVDTDSSFVFGFGILGVSWYKRLELQKKYYFRFSNRHEAEHHVKQIRHKQDWLDDHMNRLTDQALADYHHK